VTPQSWGKTEKELKEYMAALRKNTFVLCTCAPTSEVHPKDNPYMWGHYGNGHRGLAIEFDSAALASAALDHHSSQNGAPLVGEPLWVQMVYADSFRPISAEDVFEFMQQEYEIDSRKRRIREQTSLELYYRELSVIKNTVWQSENKWRLMWRSTTETGPVYKVPITPECVRTIYLGLALAEEPKLKISTAAARRLPNAEVWQASKRHGDIALDFQRVR
jgi:hypothetical protein